MRIKVFKERPPHWNSNGDMDYLMGKIVTIRTVNVRESFPIRIEEDSYWVWKESDFTRKMSHNYF